MFVNCLGKKIIIFIHISFSLNLINNLKNLHFYTFLGREEKKSNFKIILGNELIFLATIWIKRGIRLRVITFDKNTIIQEPQTLNQF